MTDCLKLWQPQLKMPWCAVLKSVQVTRSGRWACGSGCWPPGRTGGPAACRTGGWSPPTPLRTPCGTAAGTGWAAGRRSHLMEVRAEAVINTNRSNIWPPPTAPLQACVFAFFLLGPQLKVDRAAADGQRGFGGTRQVCDRPERQSRVSSGAPTLAAWAFPPDRGTSSCSFCRRCMWCSWCSRRSPRTRLTEAAATRKEVSGLAEPFGLKGRVWCSAGAFWLHLAPEGKSHPAWKKGVGRTTSCCHRGTFDAASAAKRPFFFKIAFLFFLKLNDLLCVKLIRAIIIQKQNWIKTVEFTEVSHANRPLLLAQAKMSSYWQRRPSSECEGCRRASPWQWEQC